MHCVCAVLVLFQCVFVLLDLCYFVVCCLVCCHAFVYGFAWLPVLGLFGVGLV